MQDTLVTVPSAGLFQTAHRICAKIFFVTVFVVSTGFALPAAADAASSPASEPAFAVKGFRSALFGMDEGDVRKAIAADFGAGLSISSKVNAAERTRSLTIRSPKVLPDGGAADVAYVFGYKSKKLIQVSIVWSKATDPSITSDQLVADAEVLRANFASQGYPPDSVTSEVATRDGILMFRGSAGGHTTALLLNGKTSGGEKKTFTPLSLLLLYIADAKHPDVFKLAPGQF